MAPSWRFNEAGPQGAGKRVKMEREGRYAVIASMRPARKGPENPADAGRFFLPILRFNEAGPQGAGKPVFKFYKNEKQNSFNEAGPQGAGKRL